MIHSGLVSTTFTKLPPEEVVRLAKQAGLEAIEWHGEVHVPHGDTDAARRVARMTHDAGLSVASYGSYYRAGEPHAFTPEQVVDTAAALGAPNIRVWAGHRPSAEVDEAYRARVVSESRRIADLAAAVGMTISYEYHGGTLTDTDESALRLLRDVNHPAVRSYWQPRLDDTPEHCLVGLHELMPWLSNVHVFHYLSPRERRPLAEGEQAWTRYLRAVGSAGGEHYAMIEHWVDISPDEFIHDAATLRGWLAAL